MASFAPPRSPDNEAPLGFIPNDAPPTPSETGSLRDMFPGSHRGALLDPQRFMENIHQPSSLYNRENDEDDSDADASRDAARKPFQYSDLPVESKPMDISAAEKLNLKKIRPKMDTNRLLTPVGLPKLVGDLPRLPIKRGKGHEASNLKMLINYYKQWSHDMFNNLTFPEMVARLSTLGSNRQVRNFVDAARGYNAYAHARRVTAKEMAKKSVRGSKAASLHETSADAGAAPTAAESSSTAAAATMEELTRSILEERDASVSEDEGDDEIWCLNRQANDELEPVQRDAPAASTGRRGRGPRRSDAVQPYVNGEQAGDLGQLERILDELEKPKRKKRAAKKASKSSAASSAEGNAEDALLPQPAPREETYESFEVPMPSMTAAPTVYGVRRSRPATDAAGVGHLSLEASPGRQRTGGVTVPEVFSEQEREEIRARTAERNEEEGAGLVPLSTALSVRDASAGDEQLSYSVGMDM